MIIIKLVNNMLWMASGLGVGLVYSKYKKDINKIVCKTSKMMSKDKPINM